jgi:hypothetical protein
MTLTLSSAVRNGLADYLADQLDNGSGAGYLEIRSGTRPAGPGSSASGTTLLATVTLIDPAFGTASSGVASLSNPAAVTAVGTGTATWFRAFSSDGTALFDGKVGTSGQDLNLTSTSITSGQSVDITGGTITQPVGTAD